MPPRGKGRISKSPQRNVHACDPPVQFLLFGLIQPFRFFQGDALKINLCAGAQLAQGIEIGADDLADFRITADGLTINTQDDALAIARHLHRPRTDRFGNQFAIWHSQRFPALEAYAHAIASRGGDETIRRLDISAG